MKITIYGTGCPKCKNLYNLAEEAAKELNIKFEIEKVEDIIAIVSLGIMNTPALSIDGEVKISGYLPSKEEMMRIISNYSQ